MSDVDRLNHVLVRLADAADGKRRLPVLRSEDAENVSKHLHAQVELGTQARTEYAEKQGYKIACGAGCSNCCMSMPVVFAGEAVTIARWLDQPENVAVRERFLEEFPGWMERVRDLVDAYIAAVAVDDIEGMRAASDGVVKRRVMCAFNQDGMCTIYPVRPIICRTAHALDEVCDPERSGEVAVFDFPPLEKYVDKMRPVVKALHRSIRRDGAGPRPVVLHVFEALAHPPYFGSK